MIDAADMAGREIIDEKRQLRVLEWLPLLGVLILVAFIYSPVVINAFNGDDFVHLTWLAQAVHQPELVWRNFHSAWLDITTAKFYRPLISLFMLADYIVWKGNGIGFHLTNLLSHLINVCFLWLILRQLVRRNDSQQNYIWCIASAALFGLYPLHPEAVSWITGRVDTFVTLFSLASIFCYIHWQGTRQKKSLLSNQWLYFSLISMGLALLCKEMAIILPAVFCVYELAMAEKAENSGQTIWSKLFLVGIKTSPFWLLLFVYFVVRYFALGTLVGGYDNTFLSLDNWRSLLSNWRRSVYFLCFPFNEDLLDKHSPIIFLWGFLLLSNAILIIKQVFWERKNLSTFFFLFGWLVLSLVPVYKLFNISYDLQGSRLAYLATVPLCALFCFGYAGCLGSGNRINYWRLTALIILLSAAGAGLLVNNSAWLKAELASQAIVGGLNDLCKTTPKNSVTYIVGLPDQINGAYVCRNALDGMSRYPQISEDIGNCFNLDEINHVFPFGYARQTMAGAYAYKQPCQFLVWDGVQQKLKSFVLPPKQSTKLLEIDLEKDISIGNSEIMVNLRGKPCFDIDCIKVNAGLIQGNEKKGKLPNCSLFYTNDLCHLFDNRHRLDVVCKANVGEQQLIFPLHGQADWAMGGKGFNLKLVLPKEYPLTVKSIAIEPIDKVMPVLTFQPNANQSVLGFIEMNKSYPSCQLNYDGSKVIGAKEIMLESTAPDQTFAVANDVKVSSPLRKLTGLTGLLLLNKKDFSVPGIYEIRVRAFANNQEPVGIAGDHIVVTVK